MSRKTLGLPDDVRAYLLGVGVSEPAPLAALREATEAALPERARMISSPEQAAFLAWLARLMGARRCLEVGTFTGYNALSLALALPADGQVICCDIEDTYAAVGRPHWASAGVAERIDLRIAPAIETLDALLADGQAGTFDLAFIDADKAGYVAYFKRCVQLLRPGGVIAVDNVLWSGRVADESDQEPSTVAIRALNSHVDGDPRVERVMLPLGDGLTLARVL